MLSQKSQESPWLLTGSQGLKNHIHEASAIFKGSELLLCKSNAATSYIFPIRVPREKKGFLSGINV